MRGCVGECGLTCRPVPDTVPKYRYTPSSRRGGSAVVYMYNVRRAAVLSTRLRHDTANNNVMQVGPTGSHDDIEDVVDDGNHNGCYSFVSPTVVCEDSSSTVDCPPRVRAAVWETPKAMWPAASRSKLTRRPCRYTIWSI